MIQLLLPVLAGLGVVGVLLVENQVPAIVALAGIPLLAAGVRYEHRTFSTVGVVFLFIGIAWAGISDHQPGMLLVAATGMILAWDSANHGISLREQLDEDAHIDRGLFAHLGATLLATALCGAIVYLAFLVGLALSPFTLVLFIVGAMFVLFGLRPTVE